MSQPAMTDEALNRIKILQQEIEQLQGNLGTIEQQIGLISRVLSSLNDAIITQEELKNKKTGDDILVPIGGSNYILCTIKEPNNTFISIGSGISLHTEILNSEKRNKAQIENLDQNVNQLQEQYTQFNQMLNSRRQELLQIAQQYQILG